MLLSHPDNDTADDPDPGAPAPALPAPQASGRAATVDLFSIARRLGQGMRSVRWKRAYLDRLIAGSHFPAPFPLPAGEGLSTAVAVASRWPRDLVDAWFDNQLAAAGAPVVAALDAAATAAAQARLAASAGTLRDRLKVHAGGRA